MTAERDALANLVAAWDAWETEKHLDYKGLWGTRMMAAWAAARAVLTAPAQKSDVLYDLAVLTKRLARKMTPADPMRVSALDYLRQKGLLGSPFRGESEAAAPAQGEPMTAPPVAQPAEPPATDDLVRLASIVPTAYQYRYTDPLTGTPIWRNTSGSWNLQDAQESMPLYAYAQIRPLIERQAREIARVKVQLTSEITAALAERDALRLANIDAANLLAECSDMSVDIGKYRNELAELKSERDAAQRAGVTTANYWMERAELAEDQRERTRDVWATRAERAEAERDAYNEKFQSECSKHDETTRQRREAEAERDALRECVRAADAIRKHLPKGAFDRNQEVTDCDAYDAARAKVKP